jgi:hypothetical protein
LGNTIINCDYPISCCAKASTIALAGVFAECYATVIARNNDGSEIELLILIKHATVKKGARPYVLSLPLKSVFPGKTNDDVENLF